MTVFQPIHYIIIPVSSGYLNSSLANESMGPESVKRVVAFITQAAPPDGDVTVSFEGNDPLLADMGYYEQILRMLRDTFKRRLRLQLRSNLWALDDHMIALIKEYEFAVSVDIETDQQICDAQRGDGYYSRTRAAINMLLNEGVPVEEICTLTPCCADAAGRIFGSYSGSPVAAKPYRIQGVAPMSNHPTLNPSEMTAVLTDTLTKYKSDIARRRVTNLDEMAQGCITRKGSTCTFSDCLGHVAAIAPDGRIYPCNHLCTCDELSLGSIFDDIAAAQVVNSMVYQRLIAAHEAAREACGGCTHFDYCRGGCLANAVAAGTAKDPYCDAYRAVFDILLKGIKREQKALDAGTVTGKDAPILAMAGVIPHPYDLLMNEINMRLALRYARPERGGYLARHKNRHNPENRYQNVYLRVTLRGMTELSSIHDDTTEMPAVEAAEIVREAAASRFRNVVVTGGEPLLYKDMDILLNELARLDMTGTKLVLHTSLGVDIPDMLLEKICVVFDSVVVNVEDDWKTPNPQGVGRYDMMARQLERIKAMHYMNKVSLCAAFPEKVKNGFAGGVFLEYGWALGIRDIRFISPLPPEAKGTPPCSFALCAEKNESGDLFQPSFTCGLGRSLSVEPAGSVFPCCACRSPRYLLGTIRHGLPAILDSDAFREYHYHDVDTNQKCRNCGVRYLCGGICKAWAKDETDIDSGDFDCTETKAYYEQIAAMIDM